MRMVDAHCHLDLYPDYAAILAEIERDGVYTIAVTNAPSVFRRCVEIARRPRFVRVALGLHPELAAARERELDLLPDLLATTRYVGEVGLDYVTQDPRRARRPATRVRDGPGAVRVLWRQGAQRAQPPRGGRCRGDDRLWLSWHGHPALVLGFGVGAGPKRSRTAGSSP